MARGGLPVREGDHENSHAPYRHGCARGRAGCRYSGGNDRGHVGGNRVFAIQFLLRARGYAVGQSGVSGGITRHDVAHFQRVRGTKRTGAVMRGTWERLIISVAFDSRGNAVAGVQQNLRFGYGYKNLPVTGFFGPVTRGDVRDFQRKHNIGVDGIVGPVTWNSIINNEK